MRAVGFDVNGGPAVLRSVVLPVPTPGPGQVQIRVAYAGVNEGEGRPATGIGTGTGMGIGPGDRRNGLGRPRHLPCRSGALRGIVVPGVEVSGEITELGDDVTGHAVGDPVAAYLPDGGGYAEYALAPAEFAFPLDGISLRDGGGAALALTTAYGILASAARLAAGDTVLIHGAADGVGSTAAQIARALGAAAVYGTVGSAAQAEYAKRFGYDAIHFCEGFADRVPEVDVIIDPVGGPTGLAGLSLLAPFGRLAACGDATGHPDLAFPLWRSNRSVTGYDIADLARRAPAALRAHALAAFSLLASGTISLDIAGEFPLASASAALRAHRAMGKTLLRISPSGG
ncbi:quinone oxidoreductase family protein [Streptomyces sp.]|uniref:quinone oxidoreductase family protein n=1 Tax=Streptomyces sp. TaxID=1931 RepID=UPI002F404D70